MDMTGRVEMIAKLKKFQEQFPIRVKGALRIEAEIEATEAKKLCPVYVGPIGPGKPIPGLLKASIHVEGPFQEGRRIWATIVAGGAAGAYAIPQHENYEYFHTIGQANYIGQPIQESRPFMAARVAKRIKLAEMVL